MSTVEKIVEIKESTPKNKRLIGDVVNLIVIVNTLIYIGVIVAHANGFNVKFSPSYAEGSIHNGH